MNRISLAALLGATLAFTPAVGQGGPGRLLGVSRSQHEMVEIDLNSGRVTARVRTGKGPHEIAVSPSGRIAYIPNLGTYPEPHAGPKEGPPKWIREPSGTLTRIDLENRTSAIWKLDQCRLPHGVELSADGRTVWMTCEDSSSVQELDAITGKRLREWVTGQAGVHELTLIAPRNILAVANTSGGSVTFIHLEKGILKTLPTGRATEGMAMSADAMRLYVLSAADAQLSVVDLDRLEIAAQTELDTKFPISVVVPPGSGELWIAGNQSNEMLILDERTLRPQARLALGSQPLGLATGSKGARVYVTLPRRNEIVAIDRALRQEIRRYGGVMEGDGLALTGRR